MDFYQLKMENNLVSFEVAKLAKEIGFDEFCENIYTDYLQDTEYQKKGIYFNPNSILKGRNSYLEKNEYYELFTAPEKSILRSWLIKKYNYNINTKHIPHNQRYGFSVTGNYDDKTGGIIIPYNFKGYESDEECLENALEQVLTLIKKKLFGL